LWLYFNKKKEKKKWIGFEVLTIIDSHLSLSQFHVYLSFSFSFSLSLSLPLPVWKWDYKSINIVNWWTSLYHPLALLFPSLYLLFSTPFLINPIFFFYFLSSWRMIMVINFSFVVSWIIMKGFCFEGVFLHRCFLSWFKLAHVVLTCFMFWKFCCFLLMGFWVWLIFLYFLLVLCLWLVIWYIWN